MNRETDPQNHDEPVYHSPNYGSRVPAVGAVRRVPKPIEDENDLEALQEESLIEPFPEDYDLPHDLGGDHG